MMKVFPSAYHHYLDVFSKVKAEKPAPHRGACDHHIEPEGSLPPKDGGLHLWVDYRKLNAVARKNKHPVPVPPINQLLNVFNSSSIFSKIDFHGAYNLLRIKEGDEHLTAFRTKYGSYEYLVMPFGITNAPASFQNLVNVIFQDLLDVYIVAYLNNIMVFSKSEEEYVTHVSTVLYRLRANNLFAKASKCLFHFSGVKYLGYVVSSEGLKMYQEKVKQILNWQPQEISRLFNLSLALPVYTTIPSRIIQRKSVHSPVSSRRIPFPLNDEALSQFHQLKVAFIAAPILLYPPL
ncbi:hypothetical protein O181_015132 [Austropuccinia psidii MF-1]|uniref:Reverse transcriptase domain-containing protein n=1 Tax=Austropuccinia psidii MF-1 TaxID=1389203 RepID=A0A9Q3C1J1_9BASI|nr:hypothetical protein [Austropuccinia psidii MF-1]